MPLFVLSPASLAHSALFAGYYTYLSVNVISKRIDTGVLGEAKKSGSKAADAKPQVSAEKQAKLSQAVRAHANFAEYTPFAFFLIFLAELNGAPTSLVHGGYLTLFVARVLHGSFGIQDESTVGFGRPVGTIATLVITIAAGLYNLNLGYEPLKSFLRLSK